MDFDEEIEYDPLNIKSEDDDEPEQLIKVKEKPEKVKNKVVKVDLTQDCFEEEGIDPLSFGESSTSTGLIAASKIKKELEPRLVKCLEPKVTIKEELADSSDDEPIFDNGMDFDDDHDFKPELTSSDEDAEEPKETKPKSSSQFQCKKCDEEFTNKTRLKKHSRKCFKDLALEESASENEDGTKKDSTCKKCKRKFQVRFYYKKHIAKCNKVVDQQEERPPPVCCFCFQTMKNDQALRKHIKDDHSDQELQWPCPECPKKFYIERDLFYHKVVHEVKRICDQCGKSYSTAKALARHIETHSDVKHICELCGLALKTSHSLQNHMYSHAEYYRYTCHYCGKGFRRSNSMKLHLMIHQALKPYKCRFCEKTFTDSAVSRSHMKSAHSELHRKAVERNNGRPIGAIILYKIPSLRQLEEIAKKEGKPIQDVGPYRGEEKWQEKMFGCKSFE